jgi:hypothetical protein
LLRAHIDKENGVLFPLADSILDEAAQAHVARGFDTVGVELGAGSSAGRAEARLEALLATAGLG